MLFCFVCFFQVIISYESFVYNNAVKCALLLSGGGDFLRSGFYELCVQVQQDTPSSLTAEQKRGPFPICAQQEQFKKNISKSV